MSRIMIKTILACLVGLVVGCKGKLEVTASQLMQEFKDDEKAAIAKYLDKEVTVAVPVQIMILGFDGGLVISYNNHVDENNIEFNIPKSDLKNAKSLKTGEVANIAGVCANAGKGRDIVFKNCKVVPLN